MTEDAAETVDDESESDPSEREDGGAEATGTDSVVDAVAEGEGESEGEAAEGAEALADRVRGLADRAADGAEIAGDLRALADRVAELEDRAAEYAERVEELEDRLKHKQAEFENYKKRQEREREELRERATEEFVERVVEVRDNLVRALDQDEDADLREGLRSTLDTFDRVLETENVEPIEPAPGAELDPVRHEVLMRAESDHPEGTVVDLYRPGYEMAGRVVQTAQVTVSDGSEASDGDGATNERSGEVDDDEDGGGAADRDGERDESAEERPSTPDDDG